MLLASKLLCLILMVLLTIGYSQSESKILLSNSNLTATPLLVRLENSFSLKINQAAFIESENLKLKLLEITKESRCPAETECIWPGLVEIAIEVQKNNQKLKLTLLDNGENDNSASKVFDCYAIELIEVKPYPQKNQTIKPEDYSATLIVSPRRSQLNTYLPHTIN